MGSGKLFVAIRIADELSVPGEGWQVDMMTKKPLRKHRTKLPPVCPQCGMPMTVYKSEVSLRRFHCPIGCRDSRGKRETDKQAR